MNGVPSTPVRTPRLLRRGNGLLTVGIALAAILALLAAVAPLLWGTAAETMTDAVRLGPSADHPLGTDDFGRDNLARALTATRLTLLLTLGATLLSVIVGVVVGAVVWEFPAKLRAFVLGANSIAVAFPTMVLALVIAAILGPGSWQSMLAVGIAGIPSFVRLTSNIAAPVVSKSFVGVARGLGVPKLQVVFRHILPNIREPLFVMSASHFTVVLIELSGLSFIGLGVQSPDYDFGKLLSDALIAVYSQPIQVVGPSLMLVLTGLMAMLIGDGLAAGPNRRRPVRSAAAEPTPVAGAPAEPAPLVAEVRDLRVATADGVPLVKGISFGIRPGEVLGLVGESGSGKSLTAMTLAGLAAEELRVEAERVEVCGQSPLGEIEPHAFAQSVGLVYQDPVGTYSPTRRVGGQLTEVARAHLGMTRAEARTALVERFSELRISEPDTRFHQYPHEFSGGMLQRAMIASTMLSDTRLIIADEPTTALDVTVQLDVLRQFSGAVRRNGTSVLFISHDLGVVEALCDRILVMYLGEIVEEITPEMLRERRVHHPYTRRLLEAASYTEGV